MSRVRERRHKRTRRAHLTGRLARISLVIAERVIKLRRIITLGNSAAAVCRRQSFAGRTEVYRPRRELMERLSAARHAVRLPRAKYTPGSLSP